MNSIIHKFLLPKQFLFLLFAFLILLTAGCSSQTGGSLDSDVPNITDSSSENESGEDSNLPEPDEGPRNPLTGLPCDETLLLQRPVSVMLNNISAALPQVGIAKADVIYECEVEGGLTRLLALYSEGPSVDVIGSVRSSREYYLDFAANHDAIYVHAGGSSEAYTQLQSRQVDNIDGVNGGAVTQYFYRDPERLKTMRYEHTLMIKGESIAEAIAYKKIRTQIDDGFESPLHFISADNTVTLDKGGEATEITTTYSASQSAIFAYDAQEKKYLRSQNGKPHVDGATGEQLAFDNVIILFCPFTYTADSYNHITIDTTGNGTGYLITRGKYLPILWEKSDMDSPIALSYEDGAQVYLNVGKTFISVMDTADKKTVTFIKDT